MSKLLDAVRDAIRLKRYSPRTIESYTNWILRFILYHNKRRPRETTMTYVHTAEISGKTIKSLLDT